MYYCSGTELLENDITTVAANACQREDASPFFLAAGARYENDSSGSLYLSGVAFQRVDSEPESDRSSHWKSPDKSDSSASINEYHINKMPDISGEERVNGSKVVMHQPRLSVGGLAKAQQMHDEFRADLEAKKSLLVPEEELISDLRMQISSLNVENANLKAKFADKCKELKDLREGSLKRLNNELYSLQRLYGDKAKMVRSLEDEKRSWQKERERQERQTSELRKKVLYLEKINSDLEQLKTQQLNGFDEPDGIPVADHLLMKELYRQLSNLKEAVLKQSNVIKRLVANKSSEGVQDINCAIAKIPQIKESAPVYCQHDVERLDLDHKYDDYSILSPSSRQHQLVTQQAEQNSGAMDKCYSEIDNACVGVPGSTSHVMISNSHMSGTPTPKHDHSPLKYCPICEKRFPAEMSQTDHVDSCLLRMQSGTSDGSAKVSEEPKPTRLRECPVCSAVFPPDIPQRLLEDHVNSHFEPEYEVLS